MFLKFWIHEAKIEKKKKPPSGWLTIILGSHYLTHSNGMKPEYGYTYLKLNFGKYWTFTFFIVDKKKTVEFPFFKNKETGGSFYNLPLQWEY